MTNAPGRLVLAPPLLMRYRQHVLERERALRVPALARILGHEGGVEMRRQFRGQLGLARRLGTINGDALRRIHRVGAVALNGPSPPASASVPAPTPTSPPGRARDKWHRGKPCRPGRRSSTRRWRPR